MSVVRADLQQSRIIRAKTRVFVEMPGLLQGVSFSIISTNRPNHLPIFSMGTCGDFLMITANQIIIHMVGDYVLQSDWMANTKTKQSLACFIHVVLYTLPFMLLTTSWKALLVIMVSHFVIDRWRLARYVGYVKNLLAPRADWKKWSDCSTTGYDKDKPLWMSVWLMIIVDQIMHIIINALAIKYL